MELAFWLLVIVGIYAALGLLCALAFVVKGVVVVDHAAQSSRWSFRLLILPGVAALWPLMLRKWERARSHS